MVWPKRFLEFPFRLSIFISRDEINISIFCRLTWYEPSLKTCHFIPNYEMGQKSETLERLMKLIKKFPIPSSFNTVPKITFQKRISPLNFWHKIAYKNIQYQNKSPSDLSQKLHEKVYYLNRHFTRFFDIRALNRLANQS